MPAGPRVRTALAAAVLVVLAAVTGGLASAPQLSQQPALDSHVLRAVNLLRISHRLRPLRVNSELSAAAARHSTEMLEGGYFSHNAAGESYARRIAAYYPARPHHHWMVGENLVWGAPSISAREALSLWLRSPRHRANLLRPGWRQMGVSAVHVDGAPGYFQGLSVTVITLDFGRR